MTTLTARPGTAPAAASQFAGTRIALRRVVRADRWFWLVWVLVLWSVVPATASAYRSTISDDAAGREVAATLTANPTMRAMLGPPFDLLHAGGFTMWRVGGFVSMLAGIMAILGVIRATRAEEELGRTELVRSGAIGRHALLAGALLAALLAAAVLGSLITGSMIGLGTPAAGALAMGSGIGLTALAFAGVGACAAQLTASARTARGIGLGVLGAAYLIRAVADGSADDSAVRTVRWISPLEWAPLARPYAGERWWVLALLLTLGVALAAAAFAMEGRRDHGAGLRAARPGPAFAATTLDSASGLAWRLSRGSIATWGIGLAIFAVAMGSLSSVFSTINDDPDLADRFRRMGGGAQDLTDAFYVAMLGILVVVIAILALQLAERLRREEADDRAELMLSTRTSRVRYAWANLVPALLVPTVLLSVVGASLALPAAVRDGDGGIVTRTIGAALALAPGVWLLVGLSALVLGWAPRLHVLPWLVVAWSLLVSWLGAVLGFPQGVLDATPFAVLPQLPAEAMTWTAFVIEAAVALAFLGAGLAGYARRDIIG